MFNEVQARWPDMDLSALWIYERFDTSLSSDTTSVSTKAVHQQTRRSSVYGFGRLVIQYSSVKPCRRWTRKEASPW